MIGHRTNPAREALRKACTPTQQSPAVVEVPAAHCYMAQFQAFPGMGQNVLTVSDHSRYDAFYGFRRVVAILGD